MVPKTITRGIKELGSLYLTKICIVVSTMDLKEPNKLIKRLNVKTDCIIINQTNYDSTEMLSFENFNVKIIHTTSKGLSKSRNLGLSLADLDTDFIYFADDNFKFVDNYLEILNSNLNSFYNIFAFSVTRNGKRDGRENFIHTSPKKIGYIGSMRLMTPQIIFDFKFLKDKNIKFDEQFGSGAQFGSGEENILLFECLKNGAKTKGIQVKLGEKLDIRQSTWFRGLDSEFLFNRGAIFAKMSKRYSNILIVQFLLRKYKLYKKNNISFLRALNLMMAGKRYILGQK
ncbi:glycosyltransferase, family 2 [Campylobacter mucosalis CCUG 21559]|uniref:Glycosyltransferase, family 2 n=1 Tax=Campylobacter mucosalis CCUG 21559 TaxID=1032067 RepID=A0A6G5QIE1_9BACT|nr:glycosyltransferase, family 2 [Campylobacter mucosalis CCUG 21559]